MWKVFRLYWNLFSDNQSLCFSCGSFGCRTFLFTKEIIRTKLTRVFTINVVKKFAKQKRISNWISFANSGSAGALKRRACDTSLAKDCEMREHFTDKDKTRKSFYHRHCQEICKTKKDIQLDILCKFRQRLTFPGSCPPSIISAKELNYCVRNGYRCDLFAIATECMSNAFMRLDSFVLKN